MGAAAEAEPCKPREAELPKALGANFSHQFDPDVGHGFKGDYCEALRFNDYTAWGP